MRLSIYFLLTLSDDHLKHLHIDFLHAHVDVDTHIHVHLDSQLDQYIDPATGLINTELTGPMKPPTAEATIPPADAPAEEAAAAPAE